MNVWHKREQDKALQTEEQEGMTERENEFWMRETLKHDNKREEL
jgi:hypothetical protein